MGNLRALPVLGIFLALALAGCLDNDGLAEADGSPNDAGDSAAGEPVAMNERHNLAGQGFQGSWAWFVGEAATTAQVSVRLEPHESLVLPGDHAAHPRYCYEFSRTYVSSDGSDQARSSSSGCTGQSSGFSFNIQVPPQERETKYIRDSNDEWPGAWQYNLDVEPGPWDLVIQAQIDYQ